MRNTLRVFLAGIAVLALAVTLAACGKSETNLSDATNQDGVTVAVAGIDVAGATVSVTTNTAKRIIIPAGTLFVSNDGGTQNMMVARTVALDFDAPGSQSIQVEVYCVNRWRFAPTQSSGFSVTMPGEADPVRRMVQCLETKTGSHAAKQTAVWMVSDDLKSMTFDEIVEKTMDNEEDEIQKMGGEGFRGKAQANACQFKRRRVAGLEFGVDRRIA